MESDVEDALNALRERDMLPRWRTVVEFCPGPEITVPDMELPAVSLKTYDSLLQGRA